MRWGDVKQVHDENELKRYKRRVRHMAHIRLTDKRYPGLMRKSVNASPPKCRGLREAVGSDQVETFQGCISEKRTA